MIKNEVRKQWESLIKLSDSIPLTVNECKVLLAFESEGPGATAADVSRIMKNSPSYVSGLINDLKEKKVVTFELNKFGRKKYSTLRIIDKKIIE